MEIETSDGLSFLDVHVSRKDNRLSTAVHRKPTHTDKYLHFQSNHHPQIKTGIVKCLAHRARSICSEDNIDKEINHLQQVFEKNDYPPSLVKKCLQSTNSTLSNTTSPGTDSNTSTHTKKILVLPYCKGLSESINKLCHKLNIQLVSTSRRNLKSELVHVKRKIPIEQIAGVVYKVDCSCGQAYVGETGRSMDIRMKEHQRAVRQDSSNNGIAVHANKTMHSIQWDSAQVIHRETHWHRRKILESLYIAEQPTITMNLDGGLRLNSTWVTLNK